MKKVANLIFILLIMATAIKAHAQEVRSVAFKCGAQGRHSYLSTAIFKDGGKGTKIISEVNRKITSAGWLQGFEGEAAKRSNLLINEEAQVRSYSGGTSKLNKAERSLPLDGECSLSGSVTFNEVLRFGLPAIPPNGTTEAGSTWRKKVPIIYEQGEVPVTVSYTLESIEKMFDKDVAVIGLLLTGSELQGNVRKRWAGVGHEVWDIKEMVPLLRVVEIKRGTSFIKDADLRLSYSESLLF